MNHQSLTCKGQYRRTPVAVMKVFSQVFPCLLQSAAIKWWVTSFLRDGNVDKCIFCYLEGTTGGSQNLSSIWNHAPVYKTNTSLLYSAHIYLFHTYLSEISSRPREPFYHIFDRHASLTPVSCNKVICQSLNFKKLIPCNDLSPELCGRPSCTLHVFSLDISSFLHSLRCFNVVWALSSPTLTT